MNNIFKFLKIWNHRWVVWFFVFVFREVMGGLIEFLTLWIKQMIKTCTYVIDYIILANIILPSNNNWLPAGSNSVLKVMFYIIRSGRFWCRLRLIGNNVSIWSYNRVGSLIVEHELVTRNTQLDQQKSDITSTMQRLNSGSVKIIYENEEQQITSLELKDPVTEQFGKTR